MPASCWWGAGSDRAVALDPGQIQGSVGVLREHREEASRLWPRLAVVATRGLVVGLTGELANIAGVGLRAGRWAIRTGAAGRLALGHAELIVSFAIDAAAAATQSGKDVTRHWVRHHGAVPVETVDAGGLEELIGDKVVGRHAGVGCVPVDAVGGPGEGQAAEVAGYSGPARVAKPGQVRKRRVPVGEVLRRLDRCRRVQDRREGAVGRHRRRRQALAVEVAAIPRSPPRAEAGQGFLVGQVDVAIDAVDLDQAVTAA